MKYRSIYVIVVFVFIAGICFHFWLRSQNTKTGVFEYKKEQAVLKYILDSEGSKAMYAHVLSSYTTYDPIAVHDLMHWVGEALYKHDGTQGLAVCDDSYNWGCYHGFFGRALAQEGKPYLLQLEGICQKVQRKSYAINGCFHGIGHGLLTYAGGYDYEHLTVALHDCDTLTIRKDQTACYNGVFMEYNLRTMQGTEEGTGVQRSFDPKNPTDPCNRLDIRYQKDCYFEQTDWWRIVMNRDFTAMGVYCNQVPDDQAKEGCFRGIGRAIWGESKFIPEKALKTCKSALAAAGVWPCVSIVAEEILVKEKSLTDAMPICTALDNSVQKTCEDHIKKFLCEDLSVCGK